MLLPYFCIKYVQITGQSNLPLKHHLKSNPIVYLIREKEVIEVQQA